MFEVACATDEAYLPHAAAMLNSLVVANRAAELRVHLLHPSSVPPASIERLEEMITARPGTSIVFHRIEVGDAYGLPAMGRISNVMWFRLMLPDLLPVTQRVLYLDCDILVLDSIAPLWDLDMQDYAVAAVTNVFPPDLAHRPRDLGLSEHEYFNSGVLLMNLTEWRAKGWGDQILELARSAPEQLIFPDQDALNITLVASRVALDPRWNCQNSILYTVEAERLFGVPVTARARAHPAIVHFEGPAFAKPWHYLSTHPYRASYIEHRAQTPWPDVEPTGKTLANRLRRALPQAPIDSVGRGRRWVRERAVARR